MNGSQLPPLLPPSASTLSGEFDLLLLYITVISLIFAVGIAIMLGVLALIYRRRPGDGPPTQIHGSTKLELVWTAIPLLISMSFFVWGTDLFFRMRTPPTEPLEIFVVGKQWMWKIQHQEGPREINELHIPVGQPIKLTMTSEDVIHSFFVPAFRVKQDVLPGRYTTMWFEATETGVFHLFCAEYCGTEHAGMGGSIIVMEPSDYQAWLGGGDGESLTAAGERLFGQLGCATCHGDQAGARGPSLTGVYGTDVSLAVGGTTPADESYLRESILEPAANIVAGYDAIMPTYRGQISEEGVLQLVAYIRSLGTPTTAQPTDDAVEEAGQ